MNYKEEEEPLLPDASTIHADDSQVKHPALPSRAVAYWALFVLLLVYTINQVDRALVYNISNQIKAQLHISSGEYGFLTGYGFSLIYVIVGIPLGIAIDRFSRKWMLIVCLVFWSLMIGVDYWVQNYGEYLATRIGLGVGQAGCNPAAFALITDFFPPQERAVASSIYNSGIYIGGSGLSAAIGGTYADQWRTVSLAFGLTGMGVAVLLMLTVREPRRGQFNAAPTPPPVVSRQGSVVSKKTDASALEEQGVAGATMEKASLKQAVRYLATLDSAWMIGLSGGIRSLGGYAFGGFVPGYLYGIYRSTFPKVPIYYAIVTSIGGVLASYLGGIVTKLWLKRTPRAPAYVCGLGALLSIPFVVLFLFADRIVGEVNETSLSITMVCLFFAYLTAEVWGGPAASIYQSILPSNMQGSGFSVYFLMLTIIGGAGPEIVGAFPEQANGLINPIVLAIVICMSYFLCAIGFYLSAVVVATDIERKDTFMATRQIRHLTFTRKLMYGIGIAVTVAATGALMGISFAQTSQNLHPSSPNATASASALPFLLPQPTKTISL